VSGRDYLIDTNILGLFWDSKSVSPSPEAIVLKKKIDSLPAETRCFICPITMSEMEYGILTAPTMTDEKRDGLRKVIQSFIIAELDQYVAKEFYPLLRAKLFEYVGMPRKKKRPEQWIDPATSLELGVQENDLWIVAVAMRYNLNFVSRDGMIPIREVVRKNKLNVHFDDWI
jgi:predicted nucleic acid-binding protein